nr:transcription repressor NadR [uncultured Fusobacterium sp.]
MIEREEREKRIIEILESSETLVSGTYLAELFDVSRQVIVQDIAILKARNIDIISTNRGYRLLSKGIKKIIKVKHDDSEIRNELNAIVDLGASIEDVFVVHKTYGEIRVKLDIKSRRDVDLLVENINSKLSKPLKNLTNNYHYHTIIVENENIFKEVQDKLKSLGILIDN